MGIFSLASFSAEIVSPLKISDLHHTRALAAWEVAAAIAVAALQKDAVEIGEEGRTGGFDFAAEPAGFGINGDGASARIARLGDGDFVRLGDEQGVAGAIERGATIDEPDTAITE